MTEWWVGDGTQLYHNQDVHELSVLTQLLLALLFSHFDFNLPENSNRLVFKNKSVFYRYALKKRIQKWFEATNVVVPCRMFRYIPGGISIEETKQTLKIIFTDKLLLNCEK